MTAAASDADHHPGSTVQALTVAAIGIVFGDIGTSPLYAIKESMAGPHPLPIDQLHVMGVLSLIFWSLMMVVSAKYVMVIMRADNRGEGGSLALLALLAHAFEDNKRMARRVGILGLCAAALFYGDSVITPAISVLSAVEGLEVAGPGFADYIEPLTIGILLGLFIIQRHGTAVVGGLFGPVMVIWFLVLAGLGIHNIARMPEVLWALSPHHAVQFFLAEKVTGFLALGSVVLAVTGAEALYADMGHFGRFPIRLAWYGLVWPSLLLNYFGQGALLLSDPAAIENPFFRLVPQWATMPMVVLATAATIIASQAVISGAFSITRQAIQLGYLPRMEILHTSEKEMGQIYVPFVNWALMGAVILLVLGFKNSSNLAAAYGIAVTGTMFITTLLAAMVMRLMWGWRGKRVLAMVAVFLIIDGTFFLANVPKIPHGGWFPLALGGVVFLVLTTWAKGRKRLRAAMDKDAIPMATVMDSLGKLTRVQGTAVYLSGTAHGVPLALLHNVKHNQVLHERVVLMTIQVEELPFVPEERRVTTKDVADHIHRLVLHYGFMEIPNIPRALAHARQDQLGFFYEPSRTSYFVSRMIVTPRGQSGMAGWREQLFAWMVKNAATSMDFFRLPMNRVVELGANVEL
jgi:KUP system potassium uptake protein